MRKSELTREKQRLLWEEFICYIVMNMIRIQEEIEMRKCNWNDRGIQKFGYFHQFSLNCASDAEGCGVQWTEAIVEDKYGNINNVPPSSIQFVPNDFINKDYEEHKENFGF